MTQPFIHLIKQDLPESMCGWGNGYVNVSPGHPWYGVDYEQIDCSIHGGLTYSEQNGEFWTVGFDTAHAGDNQHRWPFASVLAEATELLNQAIEAAKP